MQRRKRGLPAQSRKNHLRDVFAADAGIVFELGKVHVRHRRIPTIGPCHKSDIVRHPKAKTGERHQGTTRDIVVNAEHEVGPPPFCEAAQELVPGLHPFRRRREVVRRHLSSASRVTWLP